MHRIASVVALGGTIIMLTGSAAAAPPAPVGDVASFRAMAHAYYAWAIEDQPTYASDQGLHTWDARLTDYAPAAVAAREERARAAMAAIAGIDAKAGGWSATDQIALALFRSDIEGSIFGAEVLRAHRRDPGLYVNECSNAIFSLIKKEYAPKADRARAATARLRAMPALLDQGLLNLTEPVPILASFAVQSVAGIGPLFTESLMALAETESRNPRSPALTAAEREDLVRARDAALAALRSFAAKIEARRPSMSAPLAVGKAAYNRMLSRVLLLPVDADFVASLGQIELARAKAMESWLPDPNLADVKVSTSGASVPKSQAEFLARYEARTADLLAHIRKRDLFTVPSNIGAFRILELPAAFKPTSPGGFMNPPGIFDDDPTGFFFIPTYDPNSPNFYIRAAITDPRPILGHEGVAGHFLQLSIARKNADEIRRLHQDGVFQEGWAFYGEELMLRTGLYDDSPGGFAQVLRLMRYRAARVTVDVKLHTGEWTFDQAVDYFMKEGGLDRESATGEAAGAAATPGQKIHYTLGKWQIERLLGRTRDAKGAAFSLRAFHDELLSQASIPLSLAEWGMLGDDSGYREAVRLGEGR
ncbi:MAG: DUF885 domain-containing protein [Acidobacteria bacterium]|nr:DUF885 domain-containing protein [Acidobacteriota bacterium]